MDAHRVHLLCLLSRALAMDQATSDPVVQASVFWAEVWSLWGKFVF